MPLLSRIGPAQVDLFPRILTCNQVKQLPIQSSEKTNNSFSVQLDKSTECDNHNMKALESRGL